MTSKRDGGSGKSFYLHPKALVEASDIGAGTRVWAFAHVMKGARVGRNCNIGDHCFIEAGAILGDNVTVKNGVSVWENVTIEDNVFLGPNCVFINDPNPRAYIKKSPRNLGKTLVRANATVGANASILCSLAIGRHAFVGAGAVVLRSVPDFALIVGNPGRQIGWMCYCARRLGLAADCPVTTECSCKHCGRVFRRTPAGLRLINTGRGKLRGA